MYEPLRVSARFPRRVNNSNPNTLYVVVLSLIGLIAVGALVAAFLVPFAQWGEHTRLGTSIADLESVVQMHHPEARSARAPDAFDSNGISALIGATAFYQDGHLLGLADMCDVHESVRSAPEGRILRYTNGVWRAEESYDAELSTLNASLVAHAADTSNPHGVSKAQVIAPGSIVEADLSVAYARGAPNGVATLDAGGKVPMAQLPSIALVDVVVCENTTCRDALSAVEGTTCIVTNAGAGHPETYIYDGSAWIQVSDPGQVTSVAGKTGAVALDAGDVTSGAFSDARISQSSVVQHESGITHQNLIGAGTNTHAQIDSHMADATLHRTINDAGSSITDLWSASKIAAELAGKAATVHTHDAGDVTSGAFADARIAQSSVTQHQAALSIVSANIVDGTIVEADLSAAYARGVANGVATLDSGGKIPASQLDLDSVDYQGTWDASLNTPTLSSASCTKGHYYVVSVSGSTDLDGITDWVMGDWTICSSTNTWQKADHSDAVSSVAGKTGAVTLDAGDIASGAFADARISQTSVVQHEAAIAHQNLIGAGTNTHAQIDTHLADAALHRTINDTGTAATDLWSASKITSELSGKAASSHTHAAGDVTSGTFADARISQSSVTQHQAALSIVTANLADGAVTSAKLGSIPVDALSDVDTTTQAPTASDSLRWDGANWVPLKHNFAATTAPTATDDATPGMYAVGSRWIDTTNDKEYVCLDATDGAAVWRETTQQDTDTGEANTASNVGTAGVGVYKQKTGVDLELKKINAGSSKITVTDDTGNSEIDIDVAADSLTESEMSAPYKRGVAGGVATLDGSGKVPTSQLSLAYQEVSATTSTNTTSDTYVVMSDMTATPASGTYMVSFSASGSSNSATTSAQYAIHVDGTIVQYSERALGNDGVTLNLELAMHTQAVVTVNGAQAVDVRYLEGGSGTLTIQERNMILIKLA